MTLTSLMEADIALPTLEKLEATVPDDLDANAIAREWFKAFVAVVDEYDVRGIVDLLFTDGFWRDTLAMTWEFRTFMSSDSIMAFLKSRLVASGFSNLQMNESSVMLQRPFPDLAWIHFFFHFETVVGLGSGVIRLIPTKSGQWKAHCIYTNLDGLKDFPEKLGPLRKQEPVHGGWPAQRRREIEFADAEPAVIVIGAGQSGLEIAARLKMLDVPTLVLEKLPRIGDIWRNRYDSLCLHDTVHWQHMPYLPFPPTWPAFCPAAKIADWLEFYASTMELNVWTSTKVEKVTEDKSHSSGGWLVEVTRADGSKRTLKPKSVVMAFGLAGGIINMPTYPAMDEFKGKVLHSTQFKSGRDFVGKKVLVVGACTSGHDVAQDCYNHGVDVTLFQRDATYVMSSKNGVPLLSEPLFGENGPPTEIADKIVASFPLAFVKPLQQRLCKILADADRELIDGLQKRGFRLSWGVDGSGYLLLASERAGGYYIDVGASQLIIDGKIKLKNDSLIERFTKDGIRFENGSEIPADAVIFCTGFGDARVAMRKMLGDEVTARITTGFGLNGEGESDGVWRWCGVPNLYFMRGNFALCRYYSKHVALQIKASLEGYNMERYSEPTCYEAKLEKKE